MDKINFSDLKGTKRIQIDYIKDYPKIRKKEENEEAIKLEAETRLEAEKVRAKETHEIVYFKEEIQKAVFTNASRSNLYKRKRGVSEGGHPIRSTAPNTSFYL